MANSETSAKKASLMGLFAGYFYSPSAQNRPDLVAPPPASLASSTSATTQSELPAEVTLVTSPPSSSTSATANNAPAAEMTSDVVGTAPQVLETPVMENSDPNQSLALTDSADMALVAPPIEVNSTGLVEDLPNEKPSTPLSRLQSTYHSVQGSASAASQRLNQLLRNNPVAGGIAGGTLATGAIAAIREGIAFVSQNENSDLDIDLSRDDFAYSPRVNGLRMIGAETLGSEADMLSSTGYFALITASAMEWGSWALEGLVNTGTSVAMIPFNLLLELGHFVSAIPGYLSSFADMVSSAISSALGTAAEVAKENPVVTTVVTTVGVAYATKRAVDFGYQVYKDRQVQTPTPTSPDSQQPEATASKTPSASNDESKFRHLIDHLSEQVKKLPSFR